PARVFESEEDAIQSILDERVVAGDVVVIRNEGRRGGPGMREMLSPTSSLVGRGLGESVGLITGGRFSSGTYGMVVRRVAARAAAGGAIALVEEGDPITIDAHQRLLQLNIDNAELERRRAAWRKPEPKARRGVLAKYARQV